MRDESRAEARGDRPGAGVSGGAGGRLRRAAPAARLAALGLALAVPISAPAFPQEGAAAAPPARLQIDDQAPPALAAGAVPTGGPHQMAAVVHVHSDASSGRDTLERLAALAREAGVEALVLTENFAYAFRYAPAPLRPFFEARRSTPTLEEHGIERYLREVGEQQRREPLPALLVGVEAPVYYYWAGSLLRRNLTLHDMQRNMLIVAPPRGAAAATYDVAATAAFLRALPLVGNRYYRHYGAASLALLFPGLALLGGGLVRLARLRADRLTASYRRRRFWLDAAVAAAGVALLVVNFPYAAPSLDPYDADAGLGPFQQLIDEVAQGGGLSFWSMPEAVDHHDIGVGPVSVRLSTEPYADALTGTTGFTGFGGVYADTITTTDPGGAWDRAITAYLRGEGTTPPWLIGESAYHYTGQANKRLDDILTILLVPERSATAAFAALGAGRSYALRRQPGSADLRLAELAVSAAAVQDAAQDGAPGGPFARVGETLELSAGAPAVALSLRVEDARGGAVPIDIDVVHNGELRRHWSATTPLEHRWLEGLDAGGGVDYFRVEVRGPRPAYVLSNPIFVRRVER